jgi:hypothetical protein
MNEKQVEVKIQGITSLLFNRFMESDIDNKVKKHVGNFNPKEPKLKLYLTTDGQIYTPSTHIYGALIDAAKNFQVIGKKRSTYSKIFGSSIIVEPDAIIHKKQDWEIFSISAVNPNTRGRMMVHRPMMKEWELEFKIIFNDDDIPLEVLKSVIDWAGQYSGIGDWRPNKKGKYGKFIVTNFKA